MTLKKYIIASRLNSELTLLYNRTDGDYTVWIYKCKDKDGKVFCLKNVNIPRCALRESAILNHMKSRENSELKVSDYIENCEKIDIEGKIFIKMPFLSPLTKAKKDKDSIFKYCKQLITQLYHIHLKGVYHTDIKKGNVMYDEEKDECYIIDFDNSFIIENHVDKKSKKLDFYDRNRLLLPNQTLYPLSYRPLESFCDEDLRNYTEVMHMLNKNKETMKTVGKEVYKYKVLLEDLEDKNCEEAKKYRRLIKKAQDSVISNKISKKINACRCFSEIVSDIGEENLDKYEKACMKHNTIYGDVYALGITLISAFDIEGTKSEKIVEKMLFHDIYDRPSSKDAYNEIMNIP